MLHGADADAVAEILDPPGPNGGPGDPAADARQALHSAGLIWSPPAAVTPLRRSPAPRGDVGDHPPRSPRPLLPERLLPDVGALVARRGDDAAAAMIARRALCVRVVGTDRLAPAIASLLAAAGIGRIDVPLDGEARLWQAMPGGLGVGDEGARRGDAAAAAVRAAAPDTDIGSQGDERAPDLVVLTGPRPIAEDARAQLHALVLPHLRAAVDGAHAVIGPLVAPGRTSCLRCADLHRADRDPAWPLLAAQLATPTGRAEPTDVALCAVAAGLAAVQALAYLDGEQPAAVDGTLELELPDWRVRRRSRLPHPACECRGEAQ